MFCTTLHWTNQLTSTHGQSSSKSSPLFVCLGRVAAHHIPMQVYCAAGTSQSICSSLTGLSHCSRYSYIRCSSNFPVTILPFTAFLCFVCAVRCRTPVSYGNAVHAFSRTIHLLFERGCVCYPYVHITLSSTLENQSPLRLFSLPPRRHKCMIGLSLAIYMLICLLL